VIAHNPRYRRCGFGKQTQTTFTLFFGGHESQLASRAIAESTFTLKRAPVVTTTTGVLPLGAEVVPA